MADPLIGTVLAGRYRIIELMGQGEMGRVYLAEDGKINKKVVVKILPAHFAAREDAVRRFMQEAKTASQIGHENIVDVTDLDKTSGGVPFFVMEYLRGKDLQTVLSKEGQLRWDERTRDIFAQICDALAAAHEKGIIHRDMKPENVFLIGRRDRKEFVKILDFGIAKLWAEGSREERTGGPDKLPEDAGHRNLTSEGVILGTVFYMAPEQGLGKEVDPRADIYAVGVMLYEMLTGHLPFDINETKMTSGAALKILEMHLSEPVVPPRIRRPEASIPEEVEAIVMRALATASEKGLEVEPALTAMADALGDKDAEVRTNVARAFVGVLANMMTGDAAASLLGKRLAAQNERAKEMAAWALLNAVEKGMDIAPAIADLGNVLGDRKNGAGRFCAVSALLTAAENGSDITPAAAALGKALADRDRTVALTAAKALLCAAVKGLDVAPARDGLRTAASDRNPEVRLHANRILALLDKKTA